MDGLNPKWLQEACDEFLVAEQEFHEKQDKVNEKREKIIAFMSTHLDAIAQEAMRLREETNWGELLSTRKLNIYREYDFYWSSSDIFRVCLREDRMERRKEGASLWIEFRLKADNSQLYAYVSQTLYDKGGISVSSGPAYTQENFEQIDILSFMQVLSRKIKRSIRVTALNVESLGKTEFTVTP